MGAVAAGALPPSASGGLPRDIYEQMKGVV